MATDNANLMNQLAVSCSVSRALCARAALSKQQRTLCGALSHTVIKRNERGMNIVNEG